MLSPAIVPYFCFENNHNKKPKINGDETFQVKPTISCKSVELSAPHLRNSLPLKSEYAYSLMIFKSR